MTLSTEIKSHLLSKLCAYSDEGIFILDHQLNYLQVNQSFTDILGYPEAYLIGKPLTLLPINELMQQSNSLTQRMLKSLEDTGYFQETIEYLNSHGMPLQTNLTLWQIPYQQQTYFVGLLRSTEFATTNQHTLLQLSHYNQFTELPNRNVFISHLGEYLLDSYKQLVVVRFSIDHFDSIAHALSDDDITNLLRQLTQRIQELTLNDLKIFAHFNLSDFAMFFEVNDALTVTNELEKIINLCELPFSIGKDRLFLHLSMGVSQYKEHGEQVDMLLRAAEKALSYQQHHGGDGICWYTQQLNLNILENIKFKTQLRDAINKQQFIAYYQPKFDLQTQRLIGFEALVRWQHPERGILEPQYFLQSIIENQLSYDLFCQMLHQVMAQLNTWQALNQQISISINADATEFSQPTFSDFIKSLIAAYPQCHNKLSIEVTESSLIRKDEHSTKVFQQLQQMGILLALDDFGTGYASLSYLSYYHFDLLKIDKSFIENIVNNHTQLSIVKAILSLAKSLDMQVIAEGVEDQDQVQLLKQLGCDYAQGYYFGHPMDAQAATTLLLEHIHNY